MKRGSRGIFAGFLGLAAVALLWLAWPQISLALLYAPVGHATVPRITQPGDGTLRVEHGLPDQVGFAVFAKKWSWAPGAERRVQSRGAVLAGTPSFGLILGNDGHRGDLTDLQGEPVFSVPMQGSTTHPAVGWTVIVER